MKELKPQAVPPRSCVSRRLAEGPSLCRLYRLGAGESISAESHARSHLWVALDGQAVVAAGSHRAVLQAGGAVQLERGEAYELFTDGGAALLLVETEEKE